MQARHPCTSFTQQHTEHGPLLTHTLRRSDARTAVEHTRSLSALLVKLLEADQEALQTSGGVNAPIATATEHYTITAPEARDCAVCSHRPAQRNRTTYICAKCRVHLCLGQC